MKTIPLSIILPTYNELENIIPLISRIEKAINPQEIIVVDDNSPDGTGQRIVQYQRRHDNIKCIINNPTLGLTASIRKGIDNTRSKYVAWMDADLSHPSELLKDMFTRMKTADIVVASWLVDGGRDERREFMQKFFSLIINRLCQTIFGNQIHTYTSGYIMTKLSLLKKLPIRGKYGEYCVDFLVRARRKKLIIMEIPFVCVSRTSGQTKTAPDLLTFIGKGYGYLLTILQLVVEPFMRL
jgi:dolichol-phosphate mannosyltransferase